MLILPAVITSLSLISSMEIKDSIDVSTQSYDYMILDRETYRTCRTFKRITEYTITNNTDIEYYTWVDFLKPFKGKLTRDRAVVAYFSWYVGDFNLWRLLTDNITYSNPNEVHLRVGYSFFVELKPQSSFKYIITREDINDPAFDHYIDYAPKEWLIHLIGGSVPDMFLFDGQYLIIDEPSSSPENSTMK